MRDNGSCFGNPQEKPKEEKVYFPLLIEYTEGKMKGYLGQIHAPESLPTGVAFKILKTNAVFY